MPAARNRIRVLVLAVMICATAACKRAPKVPPGLGPRVASNACLKLTRKDLEAIRDAMIEYCETERSNCTGTHVQELRDVSIYLPGQAGSFVPETALIGLWKCEVRDGHFVMAELGRPPGRTS